MSARGPKAVVVAGATTLLGKELLGVLASEAFPVGDLKPVADPAQLDATVETPGEDPPDRTVEFLDRELPLVPAREAAFEGADVAFFAGSAEEAGTLARLAFGRARLMVDLSGRFADDPDVPLALPEVNASSLASLPGSALVAVPDAATAMVALTLAPLHRAFPLSRAIVSTYEAASGLGKAGMDELGSQIRDLFNYRSVEPKLFPRALAFNALPQVGRFLPGGETDAEGAFRRGVVRLLGGSSLEVAVTRAWIPAFSGHSASITLEAPAGLTQGRARELLDVADGLSLVDDPAEEEYPLATEAVGTDVVQVGRVRATPGGLSLWVASDNLRRGATIAAVRLAAEVLSR